MNVEIEIEEMNIYLDSVGIKEMKSCDAVEK